MSSRFPNLFYLTVFPLGHFAVDTPGGALWLLVPAMAVAWGLSPTEAGFIITAHSLGAGLGYLPAGVLGDRFKTRGLLLLGSIWWVVVGYIAASIAPSYWVVVLLLAVAGAGDAAWHPIATGTMVQHMPQRRAYALGVHLTGGVMAEVIVPLAAGFMLTVMDWQTVLRLSAVPAVLFGIAFLILHRKIPQKKGAALSWHDVRDLFHAWRKPIGLGVFALVVLYNVALIGLLAMTPLFLHDHHGYSTASSGAVFAGMLLGGAVAAPILGRLADQAGRKRVIMLSMAVAALGCVTAAFATNGIVMVAGLVVGASVMTGTRPALLAMAIDISGHRETTTLGVVYAAMDGVGALGAVLAGLSGSVDLRYAIVFASAAAGAATLAAALLPATHGVTTRQRTTETAG